MKTSSESNFSQPSKNILVMNNALSSMMVAGHLVGEFLSGNGQKGTAIKEETIRPRTLMANFTVGFVLDLNF